MTFLSITVTLKRVSVTMKKKRFALKRKSVALQRACCGEEEEDYRCCRFCHGAQNISVTNKSEEM
jgi:hypothetical protein